MAEPSIFMELLNISVDYTLYDYTQIEVLKLWTSRWTWILFNLSIYKENIYLSVLNYQIFNYKRKVKNHGKH